MIKQLRPPVSEIDFTKGDSNALVTLVEYGDYECPDSAAVYPVIKQLQQEFGPELRFVFRDFPLINAHPRAVFMATCARAAGRQNKYWEMHDVIFENQSTFNNNTMPGLIKGLNMYEELFYQDIAADDIQLKITKDYESGIKSGVNSTPSFFINGIKYNGNNYYAGLHRAIDLLTT